MIACFDIGATFTRYGLSDKSGRVRELGRAQTQTADFEAFVSTVRTGLEITKAPAGAPVSISLCGTVDPVGGKVTVANVPSINGKALAHKLTERLQRQVTVTNDADCFAMAEARFGAGTGHRNVFAIILGTGVGGGPQCRSPDTRRGARRFFASRKLHWCDD